MERFREHEKEFKTKKFSEKGLLISNNRGKNRGYSYDSDDESSNDEKYRSDGEDSESEK